MHCTNCGAQIDATRKFCKKCGAPITVKTQRAQLSANTSHTVPSWDFPSANVSVSHQQVMVRYLFLGTEALIVLMFVFPWLKVSDIITAVYQIHGSFSLFRLAPLLKALDYSNPPLFSGIMLFFMALSVLAVVYSCYSMIVNNTPSVAGFLAPIAFVALFLISVQDIKKSVSAELLLSESQLLTVLAWPYLIIVLGIFGIGFCIYVKTQSSASHSQVRCPKCGTEAEDSADFCLRCGTPIIRKPWHNGRSMTLCGNCHSVVPISAVFCPKCGTLVIRTDPQPIKCPFCGCVQDSSRNICYRCGKPLKYAKNR